jgi:hypothetical protein
LLFGLSYPVLEAHAAPKICKTKPTAKKCLIAKGKIYFNRTCALSGCHGGGVDPKLVGLTSSKLDDALANESAMRFLRVRGANRKNLLNYLGSLK